MSRALSTYARPKDLDRFLQQEIQDTFPRNVRISWQEETIAIYPVTAIRTNDGPTIISMEILGKMIGLMNNAGVTTRKSKKESKL